MAISDYSYAVEIPSPGYVHVWELGIPLREFTYAVHSGGYLGMSVRRASVRLDRLTAYEYEGGPVVWDDEFANLSAWTVAHNGGSWYAAGGQARTDAGSTSSTSDVLVRPMNGATYFEAQGLSILESDLDDRWFMLTPYKVGLGKTDDPSLGGGGNDGYRVLIRQSLDLGTDVPESVGCIQVVNHTGSVPLLTGLLTDAMNLG